jgi:hypothetical protein
MRVRRYVGLVLALTALLGVTSLVWIARSSHAPRNWTLEIEMSVSAGATSQLFWSSGLEFDEARSVRVPAPVAGLQPVRFLVPSRGVQWFRFDPTDQPGEMSFGAARLLDEHGIVIQRYEPATFEPINQIASVTRDGATTRARTVDGGNDPSFLFPIGCLPASAAGLRLALVTRTGVFLAAASLALLVVWCAVAIGRRLWSSDALHGSALEAWTSLAGIATLFAVVLAAKLIVIRAYPIGIPYLDQWDGEARALFMPFSNCSLAWEQMLYFHNEHRILLSRLLSLNLLFFNGQWDPRLQQFVNAFIHSGTAALLAAMFGAVMTRRVALALLAPIALVFAAPFGWENTLFGFQSAFYFQLLFAILSIWLLAVPGSRGEWVLGAVCALVGLGTAAGAPLAPTAVVLVIVLDLMCDPSGLRRRTLVTALTAGAIATLGWWSSSPPLAHHAALKAASFSDFFGAVARNLSWPLVNQPVAMLLLWLPTVVLICARIARRQALSPSDRCTVGLAAWTALQAAAIAYGRGRNAPPPAGRYQDLLAIGFLANTAALLAAFDRLRASPQRALTWAIGAWTLVGCLGLARLIDGSILDLNQWTVRWSQQTSDLRRFVISNDIQILASRAPSDLPHPSLDVLVRVLRDPYIRTILPASIRQPIQLTPGPSTLGFVEGGADPRVGLESLERDWGSFPSNQHENRFESQLLPADFKGFLRFSVAGNPGHRATRMFLIEARTDRETSITPARLLPVVWSDAIVREPSAPYTIVALDSADDAWIAFKQPVQVGSGSVIAEYLIARSTTLGLLSLAAAAWLVGRRLSAA